MKTFLYKFIFLFSFLHLALFALSQENSEIIPEEEKGGVFEGRSQWEIIDLLQLVMLLVVFVLFFFFRKNRGQRPF